MKRPQKITRNLTTMFVEHGAMSHIPVWLKTNENSRIALSAKR